MSARICSPSLPRTRFAIASSLVQKEGVNGGAYDPKTGDACQDFVLLVLRAYIAGLKL